ncbi:hypothetical protein [Candidatus Ferrigenium straubiae]|jgi:hypothetical protein|uniref:hypothetical protein n=1 Tax=Candidatus Ferrigenium straubiae TaxID=2919506 RepID=UPI003F4AB6AA
MHKHFGNLFLLVMLVFVCHGLMLLNDGIYWDDWMLHGVYLNNGAAGLVDLFREVGNPVAGYLHSVLWQTPNPKLSYNLVAFLSIMLSSQLVYLLASRVRFLSLRESLFVGAMFCCFTAYQTYVLQIALSARFCYFLFLMAAYIALQALRMDRGAGFLLRTLALVIFAISFFYNSLLVLYFSFLVLLFLECRGEWENKNLTGRIAVSLRYADFILLPFVYWALKNILWKPSGNYEGYNHLLLEPVRWLDGLMGFAENSFFMQLYHAVKLGKAYPIAVVLLTGIFIVVTWFVSRIWLREEGSSSSNMPVSFKRIGGFALLGTFLVFALLRYVVIPSALFGESSAVREWSAFHVFLVSFMIAGMPVLLWRIFALVETRNLAFYSLFMMLCAIFPYVLVGKAPFYSGTGTRYALLVSLPVALMLVVLGRAFASMAFSRTSAVVLRAFAGFLMATFVLVSAMIYIEWQVRWIKDSSIIENLKKLPTEQVDRVNVIFVDDQFPVLDISYNYYEYAGMFKAAWNEEKRLGFSSFNEITPEEFIRRFPLQLNMLKDFQLGGCRAAIRIRQADPGVSHASLVAAYYSKRFVQPEALPVFLGGISVVEMSDMSCP